ncbi:AMP-dependent synthetase and ligase [Coemansia reversa NRRL 1564]|uniref:AMP-dependent synthetase and ligase n=1 Tax=Coemansia reversa (strain ATCC 12441 / NRRL 1564) TaxID=763665 RepID=A0A2G5BBE4_COERN|nr:AMP-dependent synthetase and ligase [Coemansia reversa NRRL 1564]|eukprot:PIA16312.1 AMP-dependent synthetase and ligase [Coemansia reversa NRRL 1564]
MFNAAKKLTQSDDPVTRSKVAIVDDTGSYTYAQLLDDARKVRGALRGNTIKGSNIAMLMPNGYEYAAVQWGIWAAGGAVVPLSPMHPERELEYFITDSDARHVICHPTLQANLKPVLERLGGTVQLMSSDEVMRTSETRDTKDTEIDENQRALFIYTSGTTGKPKGVVHTHASISAQVGALHKAWKWSTCDRLLHMLPLHHIHGIVVALYGALWAGATAEMMPRFDADRVMDRLIDGHQDITIMMGVPTMYTRLLHAITEMPVKRRQAASLAVRRLRLTISGSAALPTSIFNRWEAATGQKMLERYGMSEIGMALSNSAIDPASRAVGIVGKPLPNVNVRLVDADGTDVIDQPDKPGMIQVKGPNVFYEYYGLPEKTAKEFTSDGWFITGDVGARNADGFYYILGRQSTDIIKSGGFKLSALEIERELLEHIDIVDAAVVGIPSEEWGEVVAAALVLQPGRSVSINELKPWCYERMARYKAPKAIRIVATLPRNLMGKLDKKAVKAMFL